jgi:hypothetical protein
VIWRCMGEFLRDGVHETSVEVVQIILSSKTQMTEEIDWENTSLDRYVLHNPNESTQKTGHSGSNLEAFWINAMESLNQCRASMSDSRPHCVSQK